LSNKNTYHLFFAFRPANARTAKITLSHPSAYHNWCTAYPGYGEGQAIPNTFVSELLTRKGMGVGKPKGKGLAVSYREAKGCQRLSRLNSIPLIFEAEAYENGVGPHKHWEWK
jgi:hypothetical protein